MPNSSASSKGFTLIEIMVVTAIVAVAVGAAVVGFNQLAGRDLDNQATTIARWMESLSDRSVLEGGLYGYRVMGNQLQAVSWFDHQWFVVDHEGILELPDNIVFNFAEDEQPAGFITLEDLQALDQQEIEDEDLPPGSASRVILLAEDQIEPLMVFLPSGQPISEGELILEKQGGNSMAVLWSQEEGISYVDLSNR